MTYKEYREKEQAEFNALPIFWAFGKEQFREAMEARGLTEADTDQVRAIGAGGYYLKRDDEIIANYMRRPDRLRELMENDAEFAESAFYYEMANHEFHINWEGDYDVCSCFGQCEYVEGRVGLVYLKAMGYSQNVRTAYSRAWARFMRDAAENDWY